MKVLGIICSPRKGGNTQILVEEALTAAEECGAETTLITVSGKDIKPCDGCSSCLTKGKCHIEDDMQEIYPKLLETDGMIWGTPVYLYDVTAQAKILLDRTYCISMANKLSNKVGGAISVASSMGHGNVWNIFNAFFSMNHIFSADFVYGYARAKGEIRKDKHAMKAARELGKQVVLLIEQKLRYPKEYDAPIYRFVLKEYGIDMSPARGRFEE